MGCEEEGSVDLTSTWRSIRVMPVRCDVESNQMLRPDTRTLHKSVKGVDLFPAVLFFRHDKHAAFGLGVGEGSGQVGEAGNVDLLKAGCQHGGFHRG